MGRGHEQGPARHLDSEICEYPIQLQHFCTSFSCSSSCYCTLRLKEISPIVQSYRRHLQGTGKKSRELAVSRRHIWDISASNSKLRFCVKRSIRKRTCRCSTLFSNIAHPIVSWLTRYIERYVVGQVSVQEDRHRGQVAQVYLLQHK